MARRFETLTRQEQIKTLVRIHNRLNKELFNNELHKAKPWGFSNFLKYSDCVFINVSGFDNGSVANYRSYTPDGEKPVQMICFQTEWLNPFMPSCKTIKRQKLRLVINMLHEMIHQYMHEKGLYLGENDGHNAIFIEERKKRGLIREETETDPTIEIDANLARIAYSIRFYTDKGKEGEAQ